MTNPGPFATPQWYPDVPKRLVKRWDRDSKIYNLPCSLGCLGTVLLIAGFAGLAVVIPVGAVILVIAVVILLGMGGSSNRMKEKAKAYRLPDSELKLVDQCGTDAANQWWTNASPQDRATNMAAVTSAVNELHALYVLGTRSEGATLKYRLADTSLSEAPGGWADTSQRLARITIRLQDLAASST